MTVELKSAATLVATHKKRRSKMPADVHQAIVEERKGRNLNPAGERRPGAPRATPARDIAIAKAYEFQSKIAPHLFARIEKALLDENGPLHEMVVEKMMMRVAPVAFAEALAKQEFKPDEETNRVPSITINVGTTAPIDIVSTQ